VLWQMGGVISFLFGPVRGYHRPQCLLTPPVSASSIYAAVVYVSGGLGQFDKSGVLLLSYPVSCVNLSMLSLILSFFLSLGGPGLRTTWHDDSLLSPVHLAVLLLQFQLFSLRLWNPDLFTGCATCPKPAVFSPVCVLWCDTRWPDEANLFPH
jgi:hypothetical protein